MDNEKDQPKVRQLFILVRHAERADDPSIPYNVKQKQDPIIVEYDPQLSRPRGKEQAIETAKYLKQKLMSQDYSIDLQNMTEIFLFSSPFLVCIETAASIAKQFNCKSISVQDQLSDVLMKNWYPEDPFIGLQTKLTNNKERFIKFLMNQYDLAELQIDYKRSNSVIFPETQELTTKRYRQFYKTIIDKYFPDSQKAQNVEKSRIVICVTHGVQSHTPYLHLFEAEKDAVYLDYCGVSIAEKVSRASNFPPGTGSVEKSENYMSQINAWDLKQFGDASHIPGLGVAFL